MTQGRGSHGPMAARARKRQQLAGGDDHALDQALDLLADDTLDLSDGLVLAQGSAAVVRERISTRAQLLGKGILDGLQGHWLDHRAPRGWAWVVLVERDGARLLLCSRPHVAREAA